MRIYGALGALACVGICVGPVHAEEAGSVLLPDVMAKGEKVAVPVAMGTGVDSGKSQIDRQDIELRAPGSGDVNELLKILPTVQFSRDQSEASRDAIQDLRPADLSISGGHFYANAFSLDGVSINSRLDVTNDNPQNGSELAGASTQTLWVDAELVGKITVFDSNVSAQYGSFTGGSVQIETRDPRRTLGATASVAHTSDGVTSFKLSRSARAAFANGTELPPTPEFKQWRYGVTVDVPVGDNTAFLVGYNRSESRVVHFASPRYGNAERRFRSINDNIVVRAVHDLSSDTKLTGQFVYSPYSSTSSAESSINSTVDSKGGGITTKLGIERSGMFNWKVDAAYSRVDTGREAPPISYNLPSSADNGAFCSSATCTTGGIGDLDQTQDSYTLKASFGTEIGTATLRGGFDYEHIDVHKSQLDNHRAYLVGVTGANIVCLNGNSLDCVTGQYALTQQNFSPAYDAKVRLDGIGGWLEAEAELDALTLRGGLRYDYESFLGNHVFAPRLTASYRVPWNDVEISLGANRYYGTSMVSYALREQYPSSEIWRRTPVVSGGRRNYSDAGWALSSVSNATSYRNSNLDTPYSDELTAAITGNVFGGTARIKSIYREGRNMFARSPMQNEVVGNGSGGTTTLRYYTMTNEGKTHYRGLSAEWARSFGKHAIMLSANWSKTRRTNPDYFIDVNDELFDDLPVVYNGAFYTSTEIAGMNRDADYAAPLLLNATWSAAWLESRLRTNVTVHYRNGFDRIEDTERNQTIDGVRYDVYELVRYADTVDVDFNIQADIVRTRYGTLTLDARVINLLDTIPASDYASASEPYQFGRSAWVGLKYRF